jgi:phage/plasmid-like protein (TIGR03299 family)
MAHGITAEDKMAYAGEAPWHSDETHDRLVELPDAVTSIEMIKAAGLGWKVETHPLFAQVGKRMMPADGHFGVVRMDTGRVLGAVKGRYQPIQNDVPFSMLDELVASGDLKYETAGSIWGGSHVWALARLPEVVTIAGDKHFTYLLATTAHDGTQALRILPTVVRVVCNNTLSMALLSKEARSLTYKVFHVPGSIRQHVPKAREALGISLKSFELFGILGDKLTGVDGLPLVDKMLERLFPAVDSEKVPTVTMNQRDKFMDIANEESNRSGGTLTGYDLLNAVTGFADHMRRVQGKDDDAKGSRRMFNTMINTNPSTWKPRALDILLDMANIYKELDDLKVPVRRSHKAKAKV